MGFGERTEKAQETLVKGQVVEVVGYIHERVHQLGNEKQKKTEELYAAVIKSPRAER